METIKRIVSRLRADILKMFHVEHKNKKASIYAKDIYRKGEILK